MASMSPRRRVGPKGASSKHVLEKGRSQTCPSKGIGPKHVPRNFRIVFVVSRLGFDLGARKNVKLRQKQIQIKDTGTSSSRKLRRAIYYTLYRMDPQKNAQDLRAASLIYIHNPIPIRTALMRCIDFITCSNVQFSSSPPAIGVWRCLADCDSGANSRADSSTHSRADSSTYSETMAWAKVEANVQWKPFWA